MALLFVPIGVGVMRYFSLLSAQFGPVVVSCTISTLVVLVVVSWVRIWFTVNVKLLVRKRQKNNAALYLVVAAADLSRFCRP